MGCVLGGPGVGTSELCARLASKFGCVHLSIEALMRTAVSEATETGRAISELVQSGKLVPAHLYLALLHGAMASQPNASSYVLEGFPKSLDNLELLEQRIVCMHRRSKSGPSATRVLLSSHVRSLSRALAGCMQARATT